jgi:hypothetical protein
MKQIVLIPLSSLLVLIACQRHVSSQPRTSSKIDTCLNILKAYSAYWKKDSLGENGFRELLGERVLMNCDCKGRNWSIVLGYLGKPDFTYKKVDKIIEYRYRLNRHNEDIKHPGTLLLDIKVDETGVITSFLLWEVDG